LGTYGAQSGNIDALSTFGGYLSQIYGQQEQEEGLPFGFGARLSYDPFARWMFSAVVAGTFFGVTPTDEPDVGDLRGDEETVA
jgi:hypothetical protein